MNTGSGVAMGAAGVAMGLAMAAETENESRRRSHEGKDQILIETKLSEKEAADAIGSLWENTYINEDNKIYTKNKSFIDGNMFFFIFAITAIIFLVIWMHPWVYYPYYEIDVIREFLQSLWGLFCIAIGLGLVCGYFFKVDTLVDFITIIPQNSKTLVQLKIYDSSGYRNLNEIEIYQIEEMLR